MNRTLAENKRVKQQLQSRLADLEKAESSRDEKELKQTRAEYEKVVNELDDERKEYQKQVEVAANASSKTTAAKAAAEEAVAAAKDSHRSLIQRLHEIAELQDNVDSLQQRVKNLTKQSRNSLLQTKWTQMKDAAAAKTLQSTVTKLQQEVKTAETKQVEAQRRATEAAKARVAAEEHAAAEAEVATRAQRVADAARADEQDMGEQLKSAQKTVRESEESKQNMSQRVNELREALDFPLRSESANADETATLNASLSKAQDQVLLLQRRSLELEDVGAREASSRRETQAEAEKLEVQMVEAKKQIEELQKKVSQGR